jgi:hypothetical protein
VFPEDWKYYTLNLPVARFKHFSLDGIIQEMVTCNRDFYSLPRITRRVWASLWQRRKPLFSLVGNLSARGNIRLGCRAYADFMRERGTRTIEWGEHKQDRLRLSMPYAAP